VDTTYDLAETAQASFLCTTPVTDHLDLPSRPMKQDPNLIRMMDSGGALPLEYVRKEQYGARNSFLASILDIYLSPPPLALERANS
jgi:hypothetical protein